MIINPGNVNLTANRRRRQRDLALFALLGWWLAPTTAPGQAVPAQATAGQDVAAAEPEQVPPTPAAVARDGSVAVVPAAAALRSIFSFAAAPPRKTMGLLQRSFLEVAARTEEDLEIAVVIDGTASMTEGIAGVRESIGAMLEDLRRGRDGEVRVAIVAYRDSGSPSGPVQVLLDRFTADNEAISQALTALRPESGAPFFHEQPDAGIHAALDRLPWTENNRTTRWLFLFGDAPPYAENYASDQFPQAKRAYATDLLVALATRKQVQIHCVLCDTAGELDTIYQQALPETRAFMNALAAGTGGLMLDLSYPDIRKAIVAAGQQPRADYLPIDPITEDDLEQARNAVAGAADENDPTTREVRVAVLPHLPFQQMSFDPREPATQVAAALRHKFESLPRVRVSSSYDVERQLRRLRAAGLNESQQIRALASQLGVDYVIWGQRDPVAGSIVSAVYSGSSAERLVQITHGGEITQLASLMLSAPTTDGRLDQLEFPRRGGSAEVLQGNLKRSLARNASTTREILVSLEASQQLLGLLADDPASAALSDTAVKAAEAALKTEPTNGMAHWLLANAHFNRATAAQARQEPEMAVAEMKEMKRSLARAYRYRNELDSHALSKEIAADYRLLVERDVPQAIQAYQELTQDPMSTPLIRRRAHWMLCGLFSGDWGAGHESVDATAAREHAIAILANWESSSEAELLKRWLGWDPETERTQHPYLPRSQSDLARVEIEPIPAT